MYPVYIPYVLWACTGYDNRILRCGLFKVRLASSLSWSRHKIPSIIRQFVCWHWIYIRLH